MKKIKSPARLLLSITLVMLVLWGCSNNESTENSETDLTQDLLEVALSSEIDASLEAANDIALDIYESQEQSELGRTPQHFDVPDCITVTVTIEENSRHITIDFGSDGCQVRGNVLKGLINLYYQRDLGAEQVLITKSYIDFYINDKNILGGKSILRERSNDNGNPQFTQTVDIVVIWESGEEASRTGTKVREWVEGHGSGIFSDNVFEISGNWISTFRDGNSHGYEVLIPLRREVICRYFVSGSIVMERTNLQGVLDFGEGACDNMATFTSEDGQTIDVVLNR
jgi:hypothetical protein